MTLHRCEPLLVLSFPAPVDEPELEALLSHEWLVTNGLGGYASGTLPGIATRRYHGLLVSALRAPVGRAMMLSHLEETFWFPGGRVLRLGGTEAAGEALPWQSLRHLVEFRLELGLPVWRYGVGDFLLERRLWMPHRCNTVSVQYRLIQGRGPVRVALRPSMHFRRHDDPVSQPLRLPYALTVEGDGYEICSRHQPEFPPLRLRLHAARPTFTVAGHRLHERLYRVEETRGYDYSGDLWTPGFFSLELSEDQPAACVASTDDWESVLSLEPGASLAAEQWRRRRLLAQADPRVRGWPAVMLALAADQFIVTPVGRVRDAARVRALGDEADTIIAGYHWFTDWGRDTMISLEGLTLLTGRQAEAGQILRTFACCIRDGLIPNLFPEGGREGLYHTADATLWFFHAIDRYVRYTGDRATLQWLLPQLQEMVAHHLRGTHFNIRVDPQDGLLAQGAEGYQLTWMDAKVGDWVVTPRRGKAVEINALWYNALRQLQGWLHEEGDEAASRQIGRHAQQAYESFNRRFWYATEDHLYDVIDGPAGDDAACRPNQVLAISLPHAVLDPQRWEKVLRVAVDRLLTPVGLRTLDPRHPDYKPRYYGDRRARDAAYHQGTVWPWLLGPLVDAWLKVWPQDRAGARRTLEGLVPHLSQAGLGSISEICDADEPYTPRGCIAQAWSVAELLRAWVTTAPR